MEISEQKKAQLAAIIILLSQEEEEGKRKRPQRMWVRDLYLSREETGFFVDFKRKLEANDSELFQNFVRMNVDDFNFILQRVHPLIKKQDTRFRKAISSKERLAITLRYLATGESMASLRYLFKISDSTISLIVHETVAANYRTLRDKFLKFPTSTEEWLAIAKSFQEKWQFPHCIGALDGKHVVIQAPHKSGSEFFNYKNSNSIVLLELADAEYKFTYIDVGAYGRESDGGIFSTFPLSSALTENSLNLPPPEPLPQENNPPMPYVIVADDAFPLKPFLMKPYSFRRQDMSTRIFNYRLSRARRVIENAFGICAARFRILRRPIDVAPDRATIIIKTICILHNFLISRRSVYTNTNDFDRDINGQIISGRWRNELAAESNSFTPITAHDNAGRNSNDSSKIRDEFKSYFITDHGSVQWQYASCGYNVQQ